AEALTKFGVPEEILTDNGKQFTARFGNGGGGVFGQKSRPNGEAPPLAAPAPPPPTGQGGRLPPPPRRRRAPRDAPLLSLGAAPACLRGVGRRLQRGASTRGVGCGRAGAPAAAVPPPPAARTRPGGAVGAPRAGPAGHPRPGRKHRGKPARAGRMARWANRI